MRFRKKPVEVEARQYLGTIDGARLMVDWIRSCGHKAYVMELGPSEHDVVIETLERISHAQIGDWIIKGIEGEFYPCKPSIFKNSYESVDTPQPPIGE